MKVTPQKGGTWFLLREFVLDGVPYERGLAFDLDEAPAVLGVARATVPRAIQLLVEAGDVATPKEQDRPTRITRPVKVPMGENRRLVVLPGYRERLSVERRVRGLFYDAREAKRAATGIEPGDWGWS